MSQNKLGDFNLLIADNSKEYIKAVDLACQQLSDMAEKEPYQKKLFGTEHVFIKALRQAVQRNELSWLKNLSKTIPDWFIELEDDPPDWYEKYRSRFIKAQILCASEGIRYDGSGINEKRWKEFAKETSFPVGFVQELFYRLKDKELRRDEELDNNSQKQIPVLLERGYGADGQAAYLVIEKVELSISSDPYPHPIKMANIPINEDFQKAIVQAFAYVEHVLISEHRQIPTFRWWVKLTPEEHNQKSENKILALEGPSFYGAFTVGMLSLVHESTLYPNTTITGAGNENGYLSKIGGLAQKCQAAKRQGWNNIIVAKDQDTKGSNDISNIPQILLLHVETIKEAMKYITSGIGFEAIAYLDRIYEQAGQLPLTEVLHDMTREDDYDRN